MQQRHPIESSQLYKIAYSKRLAKVLVIDLDALKRLLIKPETMYTIKPKTIKGKKRIVEDPHPSIQCLHRRIGTLLAGIKPPDYLYSATKGRSYIKNAESHTGSKSVIKIDIKNFFKSTTQNSVFLFFLNKMKCDRIVSGMLANLLTYKEYLPTGGSASPILSYYANKDMFDEIDMMAHAEGFTMTLYVDDICISGDKISSRFLNKVRKIISHYGFCSHKSHHFWQKQKKLITGVTVDRKGIGLPDARKQKINKTAIEYRAEGNVKKKIKIFKTLRGSYFEAAQLNSSYRVKGKRLIKSHRKFLEKNKKMTNM